jgi:nitrite reductase/ring-hydroxylating ferredoxin subunit
MTEFMRVLKEAELPAGTNRAVEAFSQSVLLCRTTDGLHAVTNECTHQKLALEGGRMRGNFLFCPVHGARFDLRTGCPTGTLTDKPLRRLEARMSDGWIEIAQSDIQSDTTL